MCGIAGWASSGLDARLGAGVLESMTRRLAHRGPDGEGYFAEPGIALGHRRLSIVDVAHGAQPFFSPSGRYVVSYNGEIYNAPALSKHVRARGIDLRTHCDTEVLVALADLRGFDFANVLEGIFAFALWDRRERQLLLARDGLGVKPLIVRESAQEVYFASELKAIRAVPGLDWSLDEQALGDYLGTNSVPAPATIWREARKLEPGEQLVWERGRARRSRFWSPPAAPRETAWADAVRGTRRVIRGAVRSQLMGDVPVGVFLSAGVDSAVVLAEAAAGSAGPIGAYCMGFREAAFDERRGARETAQIVGAPLVELEQSGGVVETVRALAAHFDEPFADSSAVAVWELCRAASQHVKVALAGDGGDEVFGGYETYRAHLLHARLAALGLDGAMQAAPLLARAIPASMGKSSWRNRARRFLLKQGADAPARHFAWKEIFSLAQLAALLPGAAPAPSAVRLWRDSWEEFRALEPVTRAMMTDLSRYLPNDLLAKVDACSMAHGLEVRVPLLDRRVVAQAAPLPDRFKIDFRRRKKLLRAAYGKQLAPVFARPKQGFSIPAARWLRGPLKELLLGVLHGRALRDLGFAAAPMQRLWNEHAAGREDHSQRLWCLMMLGMWKDGVGSG